jgi:hypothetical protein
MARVLLIEDNGETAETIAAEHTHFDLRTGSVRVTDEL